MWPDRVSNPGPPTYESGALPIALRGPAEFSVPCVMVRGYISRLGKLMKKIERLCVRTAGRV